MTTCCWIALGVAGFAQDPAEAKVAEALKAHRAEAAALKTQGEDWFAKQLAALPAAEQEAQRAELRRLREQFRATGEMPSELPATLREDAAASAKAVTKAYDAAIADCQGRNLAELADKLRRQRWEFHVVAPGHPQADLPDGTVCRVVCRCSLMALEPAKTPQPAGAHVVQAPAALGNKAQHWRLKQRGMGADRTWALQHVETGLWMNVAGGGANLGTNIILYTGDGGGQNERWRPLRQGEWLTLEGVQGRRFLAVRGGSKQEGTDLIQWTPTARDDQRFKLLRVDP